LIGRSRGSHTNVTLALQFRHPGPPFPTLLRPAGHPQNGFKFWSVGRSVKGKSHKHHVASSVLSPGPALPNSSTPCGPPPKRPSIFVGWLVGQGEVTNITVPLQFCHLGPPFPTLLRPAGHPQNGLQFSLVGWSVTGKLHKHHAASSVSSPGPTLPDPSTPCGPPPKRP
jgi:hypothetical protein